MTQLMTVTRSYNSVNYNYIVAKPHVGVNDCVRIGKAEPDKPITASAAGAAQMGGNGGSTILHSAPQLRQTGQSIGQQISIPTYHHTRPSLPIRRKETSAREKVMATNS